MIDLRSDTVTLPTEAMRAAMADAEVGDDVYGEDPTVNHLQETVAEMLGKEAALFVSSGTQGNLCSLLAHCGRGDEYIAGDRAHTYKSEGGGAAVLGSIQPQTVPTKPSGMIDLEAADAAVKFDNPHYARTRLICLENTIDGLVLTLAQMAESSDLAARRGLAHHLDGARLWNAAVALDVTPARVAAPFDSVSVCLSKGLGAPMGSLVAGSVALVGEACKWRKMLGGGLRQAGVVAAAGLHALEHHVDRLAEDHANAGHLAEGLQALERVNVESYATNMVFISISDQTEQHESIPADAISGAVNGSGDRPRAAGRDGDARLQPADGPLAPDGSLLKEELARRGIITRWNGPSARLVTHLGVRRRDIDTAVAAFANILD